MKKDGDDRKKQDNEDKDELQGDDIEHVDIEEIEEYFSKALECNDESVSAIKCAKTHVFILYKNVCYHESVKYINSHSRLY